MICYADNVLKKEVIHIWKACFPNDSEDFINFYFKDKYKNENTLVYLEEGKAIACLQMLPYRMTFYSDTILTAYISGAATLPEHQNKGIMKKLLRFAFDEMDKKNIPLSTLIPQEQWLIRFYEKIGYEMAFYYNELQIQPTKSSNQNLDKSIQIKTIENQELKTAYTYYAQHLSKTQLCIQKSFDDFKAICILYQLENGQILLAYKNNTLIGIGFVNEENEMITVKDLFTSDNHVRNTMLEYIRITYPQKEIKYQQPANINDIKLDKGMARIINAESLLQLYAKAHPDFSFTIIIKDNDRANNNKHFEIKTGQCNTLPIPAQQYQNQIHIETDIKNLCKIIMGQDIHPYFKEKKNILHPLPYMNLMLE